MYGGGLWNTWFDRELVVGGRVVLKDKDGSIKVELYDSKEPIAIIPSMCPHLKKNKDDISFDKEINLVPICGTN